MTIQDIGLFQALGAKMNYVSQRQSVIAQNIANADTPGYKPKDLMPVDFSSMISSGGNKGGVKSVSSVNIKATNDSHMSSLGSKAGVKARAQRDTYEVAPAGNAVVIEEQLVNSSQNMMDYSLMLNIYQKHVGMMKTAISLK